MPAQLHMALLGADQRLNRMLAHNLRQWGYQVSLREPGAVEGWEVGGGAWEPMASPVDVLLVDLDGVGEEWALGAANGAEPVLPARPAARLTVALGSQRLRRATLEALGAVLLVPKPFDISVLRGYLMTLERVLSEAPYVGRAALANGHKMRVLVADDDSRLTELACAMLEGDDRYVARAAHDGLEVLEECVAWEPHCLVMDMMMPRMNGYQVLRCLQARPTLALLPVVVLSALAGVEVRAEQLAPSAVTVLEKPVRSAELLAAVERVLAVKPVGREA